MPRNGRHHEALPETAADLAAEASEGLRQRPPKTSKERFTDLVRQGWINARGQVTTLLSGEVDPEPNYATWGEECRFLGANGPLPTPAYLIIDFLTVLPLSSV